MSWANCTKRGRWIVISIYQDNAARDEGEDASREFIRGLGYRPELAGHGDSWSAFYAPPPIADQLDHQERNVPPEIEP